MSDFSYTIVGSGLAGTLLACLLGRRGKRVDLYEKRPDPRLRQERGRSINLALSVRGLHALEQIGLADSVLNNAVAMPGRMIHSRAGELLFQPYGKPGTAIYSVSRAGLNLALVEQAEKVPGVRIFFDHRCVDVDLVNREVELVRGPAEETIRQPFTTLIGADGAFSAVRARLQRLDGFNYSQEYLDYGYKELTIPAGPGGEFRMHRNALHIWPRHRFMLIALPNADGSYTCTLFYPLQGPQSFATLRQESDVRRFFEQEFPDAVPLIPDLEREFFANPIGPLVTIRCRPWHRVGDVVLLGDACHAVVPFLGQGMNAAFEDCLTLDDCLARFEPDRERAYQAYEQARKEHTDTLADLAVANFVEMRDHVSSRLFILKKKTQILLHKLLGQFYIPLYTLISFSRTPYADALRRARRQDRAIQAVLAGLGLGLLLLILFLAGFWPWN